MPLKKTQDIQDQFNEYLNVHFKDRDWRKNLNGVRVAVYQADMFGSQKEGLYFIVISLIGRIDPNHSRIEVFMQNNKIMNFPIFDFTQEAQDFKRQFSISLVRDLFLMFNDFYRSIGHPDICYFETFIREGVKSIKFFEHFFKGYGIKAGQITVSQKVFFGNFEVICFAVDLRKSDFWAKLSAG